MPKYFYKCPECDKTFEKKLPMSESNKKVRCPRCRKEGKDVNAKKLIVAPNLKDGSKGESNPFGRNVCSGGCSNCSGCH